MQGNSEKIAAIGTAHGVGAVGMIRLSGDGCVDALLPFLKTESGKEVRLEQSRMTPCVFSGKVRDKIMAVAYYGEKSYTGEESAELYFHGGVLLLDLTLQTLLEHGFRLAKPGEFTRRAFLNGKIDLTQAEGIIDLIEGDSEHMLSGAFDQSMGKTARAAKTLYDEAIDCLARAEVTIDYPEEDIEEQTREEINGRVKTLRQKLKKQIEGYNARRVRREGARVVLCGKVNVGKSTLFNTLLGEERAIVTSEEGTTRDTVEEKFRYNGQAYCLIDTAGERRTDSIAEQKGIERSKIEAQRADLLLTVVKQGDAIPTDGTVVVNCFGEIPQDRQKNAIYVNALRGDGVEELKQEIEKRIAPELKNPGDFTNARQYAALLKAQEAIERALHAVDSLSVDFVCADLRDVAAAFAEILGLDPTEDLVSAIFSRFCVGK